MRNIKGEEFDTKALQEQAASFHGQGFNCAQSVACALGPELGIEGEAARKMMAGFGMGMGGMSETCGAVSGGVAAIGYATSGGAQTSASKRQAYQASRQLVSRFRDKNTSTICRELKGAGCNHPPLRSCAGCIDDAIELTVEILQKM